MRLRPLLVLLLAPPLSAACCCGPPPTLPEIDVLAGSWTLAAPLPTGSGLGELHGAALHFDADARGDHTLTGTRSTGETVVARVELLPAERGRVRFRADRSAPLDALAMGFALHFSGEARTDGTLPLRVTRAANGEALGQVVFRRP